MDALSWNLNCIYEVSFSEVHTTFKEWNKGTTIQDPEYKMLWQQEKIPNNKKQQLGYE